MKKSVFLLGMVLVLFSCNPSNTNNTKQEAQNEQKTETVFIELKDFLKKAPKYLGKEIETSGLVDHLCEHGGKKMLLVDDNNVQIHIIAEERLSQDFLGKELKVVGIVKEDRTDEAALLKLEERVNGTDVDTEAGECGDHKEGEEHKHDGEKKNADKAQQKAYKERVIAYVKTMRDSLKNAGVDHFSDYYLEYVSAREVK